MKYNPPQVSSLSCIVQRLKPNPVQASRLSKQFTYFVRCFTFPRPPSRPPENPATPLS